MRIGRKRLVLTIGLVLTIALAACSSSKSSGATGATGSGAALSGNVDLVAYSTPQEAYQALEKAFNKTAVGKDVKFTESYGASGDQSRAVVAGQAADYVAFSLAPDMDRLVKANLVAPDWSANDTKGMVTDSVVVFVTRKGNPKHIKTWDDLLQPGLQVVTPNPFTSGGARWNVMAGYGAQIVQGKTPDQAFQYLSDLFKHVVVQDDSARKSLQTFTGGKGDVLLAYENEAIFAQSKGEDIDYTIPDQTILIENPLAVTANAKNPAAAKAFKDFVLSKDGQQIFADNGYRPVLKGIADGKFPTPKQLFDISKLGGWPQINTEFFDPKNGKLASVEQSIGVSVG